MNKLSQYAANLPPAGRRILALAFLIVGAPALFALLLAVSALVIVTAVVVPIFAHDYFVPAHSVEQHVRELDATITFSLYRIEDRPDGVISENDESGRYLTVRTSKGSVTQMMCGFDWAHRARTGLYLVGDRDIAVVGVDGCDYLISTDRLTISRARDMQSDEWVYLGAFDFVNRVVAARPGRSQWGNIPFLRFIPAAEQKECVVDGSPLRWSVRNAFRTGGCPHLPTELDK